MMFSSVGRKVGQLWYFLATVNTDPKHGHKRLLYVQLGTGNSRTRGMVSARHQ